MRRTTIWLTQLDREAIKIIKTKYGMKTDSAVIRFALRILASQRLKIINERILQ